MAEYVLRPLSVGEILDRSFTLMRRRFGTLVIITLICTGVPLLLALRWFGQFTSHLVQGLSGNTVEGLGSLLLLMLVMFVAIAMANAAIVFVISETYLGRRLGVGGALSRAVKYTAPVIVLALLQQVIFVAAGIVLAVPLGVVAPEAATGGSVVMPLVFMLIYIAAQAYLLASFFVSLPALILESGVNPASALGRAWSLATGNRWRIIGVLLVLMVIAIVLMFGIMLVVSVGMTTISGPGLSGGTSLATALLTAGVMAIIWIMLFAMVYCLQTVIYYDLRVRKEGFDLELLEASIGTGTT